jgi:hypothetical protein
MRTLAICLLTLGTLGPTGNQSTHHVTVVHELVVAPVLHPDRVQQPNSTLTRGRHMARRAARSRAAHAKAPRPSWLARFGRAIGITVRQR